MRERWVRSGSRTVIVPHGRALCFEVFGDPTGVPVVAVHDTPGTHSCWRGDGLIAAAAGVCLVALDRPGWGGSDALPDAPPDADAADTTDWPIDVAVLADVLGLVTFALVGAGNGGPVVLMCAAALADRVTRVALVGDAPGPLALPVPVPVKVPMPMRRWGGLVGGDQMAAVYRWLAGAAPDGLR